METTEYYRRRAKAKHPEVKDVWIEEAVAHPAAVEQQADGRVRYYGYVAEIGRYIRVVLADGALHNAFIDTGAERRLGRGS